MKLCSSSHSITLGVVPFLSQIQQWKVKTTIYILFIHRMLIQAILTPNLSDPKWTITILLQKKKHTHTQKTLHDFRTYMMHSLTSWKGKYRVRYSLQIHYSQPLHCSLSPRILGNTGIGCWKHTLLSRNTDPQLNNQEEHSLPRSSQDHRHKCLVPRSDHAL